MRHAYEYLHGYLLHCSTQLVSLSIRLQGLWPSDLEGEKVREESSNVMEICDETGTDGAVTLQFNSHRSQGSKSSRDEAGGGRAWWERERWDNSSRPDLTLLKRAKGCGTQVAPECCKTWPFNKHVRNKSKNACLNIFLFVCFHYVGVSVWQSDQWACTRSHGGQRSDP